MAHVLLVDNDDLFAHLLRVVLSDQGHTFTVAHSDDEALAVLCSCLHPLVVLLRTGWSEMGDGYSVARLLAAARDAGAEWEQHAFFIVAHFPPMSGTPEFALMVEVGVPLLPLPLDMDALSAAIATAAPE